MHSLSRFTLSVVIFAVPAVLGGCAGDDSNTSPGASDAGLVDVERSGDATVADAGHPDSSSVDGGEDATIPDGAPGDAAGDGSADASSDGADAGGSVTLQILQTTDLHANVVNYDYFAGTDQPTRPTRGIAPLATILRQERAKSACSITLDSGDTIQGTPLGTYFAMIDTTSPHPMAAALNAVGYDAVALGNHEFNYGLDVLHRYTSQLHAPVLAANVRNATDHSEAYTPYLIKSVCGVSVGILGLVTPGVATWDAGDHIKGLAFDSTLQTAKTYVPKMKAAGADVVIITVHQGPEKHPNTAGTPSATDWLTDPSTWAPNLGLTAENEILAIAEQVPGVDVIASGHTHLPIPKIVDNGVLIGQPSYWGSYLGEYNVTLARGDGGAWSVTGKDSQIVPVPANTTPDPAVLAVVHDADTKTRQYVQQVIGQSAGEFPGGFEARFTDSALADLINVVQEEAADEAAVANGFEKPTVSLAAIFNNTGHIPQGSVKLSDAYSIYIYDNTLYVMKVTGATLRLALEENAQYFRRMAASPTLAAPSDGGADASFDPKLDDAGAITVLPGSPDDLSTFHNAVFTTPDYNWDVYKGIKYTVDATQPAGKRITSLTREDGTPIQDSDTFTVVLNNYRGGGGGYGAFGGDGGTLLWRSADGVRDYVAAYIGRLSADGGVDGSAGVLDPASYPATCDMTLVPNLYSLYYDGGAKCAK
jgi:2',3'-cyclic-nucleotide 2'-phosphodiesterase/3'-nucleotidase